MKMPPAPSKTLENEIRARAYQIYESNGQLDHRADQDWLQAERELFASGGSK